MKEKKDKRNYGIDLLRIIAMFYVVLLHSFRPFILEMAPDRFAYYACWFFEIFAYCAVDIFAIITGYVSYRNKKRKGIFSNYIQLWLEVVFYCFIITIIFLIISPSEVPKKQLLYSFIPVLGRNYWYFTAYTGLVILVPILDIGLRKISKTDAKKVFLIIVFFFSIYAVMNDGFGLYGGYTVIWLVILYILGAIIKKCDLFSKLKTRTIIIIMIFLFLSTVIIKYIGKDLIVANIYFSNIFSVNYISPTILGISILYLILFSKINFNEKIKKIITFFSPTTFAIYLLNSNYCTSLVLSKFYISLVNKKTIVMITVIILFDIQFVIIAMLIDKIRIHIFNKSQVKEKTKKIEIILNKRVKKLTSILD